MNLGEKLQAGFKTSQLVHSKLGRWALAAKIPSLGFWGVYPTELNDTACTVRLPFSFRTQNPFQSVYFSAQLGAGELATGLLLLKHIEDLEPKSSISMLVVEMQSQFLKKAKTDLIFECDQGQMIQHNVQRVRAGEAVEFWAESTGRDQSGDKVAVVKVKWSLIQRAERMA